MNMRTHRAVPLHHKMRSQVLQARGTRGNLKASQGESRRAPGGGPAAQGGAFVERGEVVRSGRLVARGAATECPGALGPRM
jgi:hypothetical protein